MEARAIYISAYTIKIFLQTTILKIDGFLFSLVGYRFLKEEILK